MEILFFTIAYLELKNHTLNLPAPAVLEFSVPIFFFTCCASLPDFFCAFILKLMLLTQMQIVSYTHRFWEGFSSWTENENVQLQSHILHDTTLWHLLVTLTGAFKILSDSTQVLRKFHAYLLFTVYSLSIQLYYIYTHLTSLEFCSILL